MESVLASLLEKLDNCPLLLSSSFSGSNLFEACVQELQIGSAFAATGDQLDVC